MNLQSNTNSRFARTYVIQIYASMATLLLFYIVKCTTYRVINSFVKFNKKL